MCDEVRTRLSKKTLVDIRREQKPTEHPFTAVKIMLLEVFNAGTSDAHIFFIAKLNREICNVTGNLPCKY